MRSTQTPPHRGGIKRVCRPSGESGDTGETVDGVGDVAEVAEAEVEFAMGAADRVVTTVVGRYAAPTVGGGTV